MTKLSLDEVDVSEWPSIIRKTRYLGMLQRRLANRREQLREVLSLAEQWDRDMDNVIEASSVELQELRPFLAVDRTVLEEEISRLARQIELVARCGFAARHEPTVHPVDAQR